MLRLFCILLIIFVFHFVNTYTKSIVNRIRRFDDLNHEAFENNVNEDNAVVRSLGDIFTLRTGTKISEVTDDATTSAGDIKQENIPYRSIKRNGGTLIIEGIDSFIFIPKKDDCGIISCDSSDTSTVPAMTITSFTLRPTVSITRPTISTLRPTTSIFLPSASIMKPTASIMESTASVVEPITSTLLPTNSILQPISSTSPPITSTSPSIFSSIQPVISTLPPTSTVRSTVSKPQPTSITLDSSTSVTTPFTLSEIVTTKNTTSRNEHFKPWTNVPSVSLTTACECLDIILQSLGMNGDCDAILTGSSFALSEGIFPVVDCQQIASELEQMTVQVLFPMWQPPYPINLYPTQIFPPPLLVPIPYAIYSLQNPENYEMLNK